MSDSKRDTRTAKGEGGPAGQGRAWSQVGAEPGTGDDRLQLRLLLRFRRGSPPAFGGKGN